MVRTLSTLVVAVQWSLFGYAATYYVATNGSDSNPGTQLAPFRHVSRAASAARRPGDTVLVMDGTYDNEGQLASAGGGGSVVTLNYSGSSGKPISFRAVHRGKAILDAMSTSTIMCTGAWAYFDLKNASFIVIQGFVIQHGCYNGIRSNDNAHDIVIKWNEFRNIGNWANPGSTSSPSGIYINSGEYNFTFDGNSFHDIGGGTKFQEHGIYTSASNVTIINNIFYNNSHGWGIQTSGGANVMIANNTFAFPNPNTPGQIMLWDGRRPSSLSNVTVRNNLFYNPTAPAVVTNLVLPIAGSCTIDHNITTVGGMFDGGSPCDVGSNRTNTDPQFVNTSAPYDFHLKKGSPAIGAGMPVSGLAGDFDGAPRAAGNAADAGACGFVSATLTPVASVQNGASLAATSVTPGQVVAIFGSGMGPAEGTGLSLDVSGFVDTMLAGTRVLFDGQAAPLIYSSSGQVIAIVPYEVSGQASTSMQVEYEGAITPGVDLEVGNSAPGIFTSDSSGLGQGAILNADFSTNSAANPATRGSIIVIYATGEGQTDPGGVDGLVVAEVEPKPVLPVSVTIDGQAAEVMYVGEVSGLVSGILQVDARVPSGVNSGNVVVVLTVGGNPSAPGVTMAVF